MSFNNKRWITANTDTHDLPPIYLTNDHMLSPSP